MDRKIIVTQNVEYSLKILEKAVKEMSEGETKEHAKGAIEYLLRAASGEEQLAGGDECPAPLIIFPSG
jgi:hypothetical protein